MRLIALCFIVLLNIQLRSQGFDFYPKSTDKCELVSHSYYKLCYSEKDEQPEWVAYMLTSDMVRNSNCKRSNNFRADAKVTTGSATPADYKNSGYDKGHMCPAGDMGFNCTAMSETFFMSNMSPQLPGFNRGIWKKLEELVRSWADAYDTIYVVTGPVLNGESTGRIGENNVTVPKYYYKVVYKKTSSGGTCIALLLPNEASYNTLQNYVISVDSLEKLTQIDFFPVLPDNIENVIENKLNTEEWKFK